MFILITKVLPVTCLKAGDLIFLSTSNAIDSSLTNKIQEVGLNFSQQKINHVGIYIGNNQVVEATPPIVKVTNLKDFIGAKSLSYTNNYIIKHTILLKISTDNFKCNFACSITPFLKEQHLIYNKNQYLISALTEKQNYNSFFIKRCHNYGLGQIAANFALSCAEMPYNTYYLNNFKGYYCSQLVMDAYKYANKSTYFKKNYLKFNIPQKSKSTIDSLWVDYYGGKTFVPIQELGSHPAAIYNSKQLRMVF